MRPVLPPPGHPALLGVTLRGFPAFALSALLQRYVPEEAWRATLAQVAPDRRAALELAVAELQMAAAHARDLGASRAAVNGSAAEEETATEAGSAHELSTDEAAGRLGVTANRVRQLCRAGELQARQVGKTWLVDAASVQLRSAA